ncbi:MAG: ThuA domain-containing protein [Fidelibacterota bacterium]|nr:MAG: ThuA domain-containing protein [Candidatus Neomarinimicrobiota bacterium]
MLSRVIISLVRISSFVLLIPVLFMGCESSSVLKKVLIIQDELPQIEVLAEFLRERGGMEVVVVDQEDLPSDFSPFSAVIGFIHGDLKIPTEKAIIDYTLRGGRHIVLHHTISSGKAENEFYFDFLGIRLDNPAESSDPVEPGGGYGWRHVPVLTLVNLNPQHYIINHKVNWGEEIPYTPSDFPSAEGLYPSLTLESSEVYLNHKYTDGREKTVLMGLKYFDDRNQVLFMQDRAGWIKRAGKGDIIYLLPGHEPSDYENRNISQMVLNAVNWVRQSDE